MAHAANAVMMCVCVLNCFFLGGGALEDVGGECERDRELEGDLAAHQDDVGCELSPGHGYTA